MGPQAAVDEFAAKVRMVWGDQVGDESTDYSNRNGHEVRRYLAVIVPREGTDAR